MNFVLLYPNKKIDSLPKVKQDFSSFCKDIFFDNLQKHISSLFSFNDKLTKFESLISVESIVTEDFTKKASFTFEDHSVFVGDFNYDSFISLIYTNEEIYKRLGQTFCSMFDLYFSKAGNEIPCETFF